MTKQIILLIFSVLLGYQATAASDAHSDDLVAQCIITFTTDKCVFKHQQAVFNVELISQHLADEKLINEVLVSKSDKTYRLPINPHISMFDQDIGYLVLQDINFDGSPDLALSTSFGVANQYFDYWVYLPEEDSYHYLGNMAKLELDSERQEVRTHEKVSAYEYKTSRYIWEGRNLVLKE